MVRRSMLGLRVVWSAGALSACADEPPPERDIVGLERLRTMSTSEARLTAVGTADAGAAACTLSEDCDSVPLVFLSLEACCTASTSCGFAVRGGPPELQETVASALDLGAGETCAPRDRYFLTHPGSEDLRIADDDGEEILLTTGCRTASILSISFIGCCMPNDRCGVSTYGVWDTLGVLAPGRPFSRLECVSSKVLNAQLEDSQFRGLRFLPDTDAPCDHAALDAQLPPVDWFLRHP